MPASPHTGSILDSWGTCPPRWPSRPSCPWSARPDEFLVAKPGIPSISQLRDKPVAYTTGTAEQAFALRALKSAGLTQKDVQQVDVSLLQLGTVLESGAADASVVSVEQKIDYQQTHAGAKVLANVDTVTPPSYGYLL